MYETTLLNFESAGSTKFFMMNDTLNGGRSEVHFFVTSQAHAEFSGVLSDYIQHCYASVRLALPRLSTECLDGLSFIVKGDGRRYQCRLKTDDHQDEIEYMAEFQPQKKDWDSVRLSFSQFMPYYRGMHLSHISPINPENISSLCLSVNHVSQAGPYKLLLKQISTYSKNNMVVPAQNDMVWQDIHQ